MQRIGLIGSDNSHVERFTEILNLEEHSAYWPDSGATVWAIWGDDEARTAEGAENGRIPVIASSPEEVAEMCDLVFATSRRPEVHLAHARPAIDARKPLFVDKPLSQTPEQGRELLALVEDAGIPMTCFSTLRYGSAANSYRHGMAQAGPVKFASYLGPCTRKNDYGGIIFYGIHIAELMQEFHGAGVVSVEAVESPAGADQSNISAACTYEDGALVTLGLIGDGTYLFHMLGIGAEGIVEVPGTAHNYAADAVSRSRAEGRETSTPTETRTAPEADHYENGVRKILAVLRGEEPGVPHEQMLRSVQLCTAIEESLVRGVPIDPRSL